MIAEQEMDLSRILAFESRHEVDQLVGLITAGRVAEGPVNQFLQDEVPLWIFAKLRFFQQEAKILHIPVQVARYQDFASVLQANHPAAPTGGSAEGPDSLFQCAQKAVGVRHASMGTGTARKKVI
jgi:hypothetical protein